MRRGCRRGEATALSMRRRKLVITLAAAAMFGVLSVPASAELHRVTVRLTNASVIRRHVSWTAKLS